MNTKNNPENSSSKHIPSGFSMSTISSFKIIENKHNTYRGKDCMKKFCEFLREHAMKIINFENKKMNLLTEEQKESQENAKICYICKENLENKYLKISLSQRSLSLCIRIQRCCAQNLRYSVTQNTVCQKKIPIVFHNGSNYDYHFIIKELAEEFKKQFTCLEENTEKYITFTISIEKEIKRIDKNGKEITKKYILNITVY